MAADDATDSIAPMFPMSSRRTTIVVGILVSWCLRAVRAESAPSPAGQGNEPFAVVPRSSSVPTMTAEQLEAFAQLVGEPLPAVLGRLQLDPGLLPLAVDAAKERVRRKRSGKWRVAVGFGMVGLGAPVGYIVKESSRSMACDARPDTCDRERGTRQSTGIIIAVVSAAVGLGIGIPGLVRMGKQSEAEYVAVNRYQEALPQAIREQGLVAAPCRFALSLPLLGIHF